MKVLVNAIQRGMAERRGHRTTIIGALSEKEFTAVTCELENLAREADDWPALARGLKAARKEAKPFQKLTEPEWVQLCNCIAAMLVNVITKFSPLTWAYSTGTQAA